MELVQKREDDLKLDALSYNEWVAGKEASIKSDAKERSYRLVSLRGQFQHWNQILIGPRGPPPGALAESGPNSGRGGGGGMSSSMQGYWILTPFVLADDVPTVNESSDGGNKEKRGWFGLFRGKTDTKSEVDASSAASHEAKIVWINRGWIPRHYISKDLKVLQQWKQPEGTVEIMTMESETETPGRFSPPSRIEQINSSNDGSDRVQKLLWLDRQAIAEMTNCPSGLTPPLFVQIKNEESSGATFPARSSREYVGEFKVTPEVHVGYATTWFGLSGAGILMTRKLLSRGR